MKGKNDYKELVQIAFRSGAYSAKVISIDNIVVDERVRLKCQVPLCSGYRSYLTCPPYIMKVQEFKKVLSKYKYGIVLQVEAENIDSLDKTSEKIDHFIEQEMEKLHLPYKLKLLEMVEKIEAEAFKRGMRFASGFIGGSCPLCKECVQNKLLESCRHPFRARPPMEGVGIDVVETLKKVGLSLELSSQKNVLWTGLVLLE